MLDVITTASRTMQRDVMTDGRQAVLMYSSWQHDKRLNLSVDILDAEYTSEHADEIRLAFDAYIAEVREAAAADGIPI